MTAASIVKVRTPIPASVFSKIDARGFDCGSARLEIDNGGFDREGIGHEFDSVGCLDRCTRLRSDGEHYCDQCSGLRSRLLSFAARRHLSSRSKAAASIVTRLDWRTKAPASIAKASATNLIALATTIDVRGFDWSENKTAIDGGSFDRGGFRCRAQTSRRHDR